MNFQTAELYHWVMLINFSNALDLPISLHALASVFPLIISHTSLLYYIIDLLIFHFVLLWYSMTMLLLGSQMLFPFTKMLSQHIVPSVRVPSASVYSWVLVLQKWVGPLLLLQKVYSWNAFTVLYIIYFHYVVDLWWSITCYEVK